MIINNVLNEIFSKRSNVSVLRILNKHLTGITGREVARLAGLSPKNCLISLTDLENLGVITRVRGGRDHHFTINRKNFLVKNSIIPLLKSESNYEESIYQMIINKMQPKCISVILFGSVARKEERISSDLDLCLVYDEKDSLEAIEDAMSELQAEFRKKFHITASPFYITESEFKLRSKKNRPPVTDIIKEGKLIFGKTINGLLNDTRNKKSIRRKVRLH